MPSTVEIEDIEEMRRQQGIDDVELRMEIRQLKRGDFVMLTVSSNSKSHEPALVCITHVRGSAFRGKFVKRVSKLRAGEMITFTTAHIHSVLKRQETQA